jgi:hypothetical protein
MVMLKRPYLEAIATSFATFGVPLQLYGHPIVSTRAHFGLGSNSEVVEIIRSPRRRGRGTIAAR